MKFGNYPAIIRKEYEDGTIAYETEFDDDVDLLESVNALISCIGQQCGTGIDARILRTFRVVYGADQVAAELQLADLTDQRGTTL